MYDVNHWPDRCPYGHTLGPGTGSLSWDMSAKRHVLVCGGCRRRTQLVLGEPAAQWRTLIDGHWVTAE